MNLRKIVAFSQIGLATRFPTPSVHAMLPDLDGRTHAPSVGADVEKFRASAKRFDRKACSKMDLRSDEERRGATRAEEQWTAQQVRRCRPPRWLPCVRAMWRSTGLLDGQTYRSIMWCDCVYGKTSYG